MGAMLSAQIKELAVARAKVTALEHSVATELKQELGALPAQYGFESADAFIAAVRAAAGKRRGRKPGAAKSAAAASTAPKKRKRAKITDKTRASVKQLVGEGKTGNEIAKALGISLPSVQNIKKALGLVGKSKPGRKKKAAKA